MFSAKRITWWWFCLVLTILLSVDSLNRQAHAQRTTIRPIEDFVEQQGTFCFPDGVGGCLLFVPPIENFFGFSDGSSSVSIDYAGLADRWIKDASGGSTSFDTDFSGTVIERPLEDGRAEITVNLHTSNALAWVADGSDFNNPLLFGNRAPEVLAAGAEPALIDSSLTVKFINSAPGADLPDLLQLAVAPEPGQELFTRLSMNAHGEGPLQELFGVPAAQRGRLTVSQVGIFDASGRGALQDGFPVERVNLQPIGSGSGVAAVPEPSPLTTAMLGFSCLVGYRRRRRNQSQ